MVIFCILYSKLSSEWLTEAERLCKNVLHITSSPSPSNFDKDAVLLHHFSSTLNLQLGDDIKLPSVSGTFYVVSVFTSYCIYASSVKKPTLVSYVFCWVTLRRGLHISNRIKKILTF